MNTTMKNTQNTTEIKCPHCGEPIVLDKSAYTSIAQQVRDIEFNNAVRDAQAHFDRELAAVTATHKAEMEALAAKKDAEAQEAIAKSEVESNAFYEAANESVERMKNEIKVIKAETAVQLRAAEEKIKGSLAAAAREKDAAVVEAKAQTAKGYSERITQLEAQVRSAEAERKLAVNEALQGAQSVLATKEREIDGLRHKLEQQKAGAAAALDARKNEYALMLRQKDEEIAFYKDFKLRQSTKMLGETLEQHCLTAFEQVRHPGFSHAYFEKDNDASGGSKGDFIYRDFDEQGVEFISIMFEMKNEADDTIRKHKNEDFFKKLDADRNAKGCEYAVLVSTLESDSELYNTGIVDVSHRYPKMFVVRPNFFIPLLSILRNAAFNTVEYREEAEMLRNQHFDVQQFAEKLGTFKDKFGKSCAGANKQIEKSIKEIDKAITCLQNTKDALEASAKHLEAANTKAEGMTLQRLTRGNPTMKQKFKEAGVDITKDVKKDTKKDADNDIGAA